MILGAESSQSQTASFLGRTLILRQWRIEYEPDPQHVSRALNALGLTRAKGVATPTTDDVGGPKARQISDFRRTAKWHDPPEEVGEEGDLLSWRKLKFPCCGQTRPLVLSFTTYTRFHYPQESCTIIKYPRMTCRYPWTQLDSNIEVFGDANFAGCLSTRISTMGGVAMWSGQFVKAWSKTV